ncbi:MAG: MotA/TolQ/ExbB proton channel family protein [Elusimicrobia bacterium]|nr:MotA/TolQ/ExbB proton channel family protein [Elusimicrobiota bacterium]
MTEMSLAQMLRTSVAMPILFVLSIIVLAQALERLYVFWVAQRMPHSLWERIKNCLEAGDLAEALGVCRFSREPMGEAFERLLSLPEPDTEALIEAFQLHRQRMQMALSRRVGLFGTASFISPLIGLMGTVLGIMRAFHDLSVAGAGGPAVVAAGISEALVATAAGIGVAVMSAVFYNYFTLSARQRLSTADLWVFELAGLLSRTRQRGERP